jgi:hypothetical protein
VINVYSVNPNINNSFVTEIQNSTSPNHRTEYRLTMARRTRPTPMRMAGCSESVQYSTMTLMAVSSKQMRASWVMMYCGGSRGVSVLQAHECQDDDEGTLVVGREAARKSDNTSTVMSV